MGLDPAVTHKTAEARGTMIFMPPETFDGAAVSFAHDVYSLGIICECLLPCMVMPCSRSPATPLDTLPVLLLVPERLVTELKCASRRSFRCPAVYYLYVGSSPYGPTASPAEVMRHKLAYSSPTLNSRFPRPLPGHCPPQYERLVLDCTVPDRKARCTQERFGF